MILIKNKNIKCCNFLKGLSKICPVGHLILIFIRRILPTPWNIWTFQGFSQTCVLPQFIWSQHWIWWDSFFLKRCWGTCLNDRTKTFQGSMGRGGRIYNGWCHGFCFDVLKFSVGGWEGGKGGRVVRLGIWEKWKVGLVEKVEKVIEWWAGKVGGVNLYSRVGDADWVQYLFFLFLMLIKGTKRWNGFKIFRMAPGMERLSLHLLRFVRNIICASEVWCGCG